ncbi:hypothetical protein LG3211_0776 [Lysobacter gummosus]|nr:hypothetical protein LG3211_0776 [Lysobacter gummosus]
MRHAVLLCRIWSAHRCAARAKDSRGEPSKPGMAGCSGFGRVAQK